MDVVIFEGIMLFCFGLSWPISVYKSITSKSTKGKSVFFLFAILVGYISGITGKIVGHVTGKADINIVLALYIINFLVVSTDVVLYFINRKREKKEEQNKTK